MKDEDLLTDIHQAVAARSEVTADFSEPAFAALVTEHLVDNGTIAGFEPVQFKHRGMRIDGYAFVDDEATLDLFAVEWSGAPEAVTSLTRTTLDTCFRRVETFFDRAVKGDLAQELDVSHAAWGLARHLGQVSGAIIHVRVNLVSDCRLSAQVKSLPSQVRDGREWSYRVFDLVTIGRLLSTGEPETIEIDFVEQFGSALPCLPANTGGSGVDCYLTVVPGRWLAAIYEQYSGRLLEQNVRTFLQVKGGVNKGIRRTILDEPEMFFAYNNGISATAEAATIDRSGKHGGFAIRSVRHLQVVNGGQTTASIFNVMKKDRDKAGNIDQVSVQMKLSVVGQDRVTEIVPRISEYANSQNKVSAADFFSNHPFHVRMESNSRRIWAPALDGTRQQTHWFYERARGQYVNAVAYLSPSQKKEFEATNPRRQLIHKTDLAKAVMAWRGLPHIVCQGAQKNFGRFAELIAGEWKEEGIDFGEDWFRETVAKFIVFRTLERLVQEAPWYAQGFRAQVVAYTIALVQCAVAQGKSAIDFRKIWNRQAPSATLNHLLIAVAQQVQIRVVAAAVDFQMVNVTEWCKKERCWDDLKARISVRTSLIEQDLTDFDEVAGAKRQQRRMQREANGDDAQVAVVNQGPAHWSRLLKWAQAGTLMTPSEIDLLKIASAIPRRLPTPPQCQKLIEIEKKARSEGFRSAAT